MPQPSVKLSLVFLNYNRLDETRRTLQHLRQFCSGRKDIEIIAVDNGSTDGTAEFLQHQTGIQAVLLADNTGIAGYNEGFKRARGQYILVLDDDSNPQSLPALDNAVNKLEQTTDIGIIACRIITQDGGDQWSWHLPAEQNFVPSPFFIGCGFIIRRSLFEKTGWYPESFFLYQNEIEVAFQTRLQGFDIYYDPECIVIHRGKPGQRPGWRRVFFPTRNTLWLIRRYYPQPLAAYMLVSRIVIGLVRAIQFFELASYFRACYQGLRTPVQKTPLPARLQTRFMPFQQQNSLIWQLRKWCNHNRSRG